MFVKKTGEIKIIKGFVEKSEVTNLPGVLQIKYKSDIYILEFKPNVHNNIMIQEKLFYVHDNKLSCNRYEITFNEVIDILKYKFSIDCEEFQNLILSSALMPSTEQDVAKFKFYFGV